jgi:carboxylesterase type B
VGTSQHIVQQKLMAIVSSSDWPSFLKDYMQTPTNATISSLSSLFPDRDFKSFMKDIIFACHARRIAETWGHDAYRYIMSIPPAVHGQDQLYYFYNEASVNPGVEYPAIAKQFQEFIREFVTQGIPRRAKGGNAEGNGHWPAYSNSERVLQISKDGFSIEAGELGLKETCKILESIIYDPSNGW